MAIHNTSDSVDKKVTIQDIFTHAQASGYINPGFIGYSHTQASAASTWTVAHNLNSSNIVFQCFDNSSPAETLIPDTVTRNLNSLVLTFAGHTYAGTCVVGTPYGTATANNQPSIDFIAGEDIGTAKMVRMGITGRESGIQASYIPSPVTSTFDTVSSTKTLYQTFKAQRATAIAVQLYAKKTAAPDTTSMTVEIYATTTQTISSQIYNVPTGSALGTSTIASGSLSTAAAYVTATLTVPITTLTPGNYYAIKIV